MRGFSLVTQWEASRYKCKREPAMPEILRSCEAAAHPRAPGVKVHANVRKPFKGGRP